MERYILTETSYFGRGCRAELPNIIKDRNFRKVLIVTDKPLVDAGVISKITTTRNNLSIKYSSYFSWMLSFSKTFRIT